MHGRRNQRGQRIIQWRMMRLQFCGGFGGDGRQGVVERKITDVAKMANLVGAFKWRIGKAVGDGESGERGADDSGESVRLSQFPSTDETD